MHHYPIVLLISFLIIFFQWFYLLGMQRHTAANRSFLLFSGFITIRLGLELVAYLPFEGINQLTLLRVQFFFWEPTGFLALLFVYKLTRRKAGIVLWLGGIATGAASIFGGFSTHVITGYTPYPFGNVASFNAPYQIVLSLLTATLGALAIGHLVVATLFTKDKFLKPPLVITTIGAACSLGIAFVFNISFPDLLGVDSLPRYGAAGMLVLILCVFFGASRFNFFGLTIENLAEDLFEEVTDGIALIGRNGSIRRLNKTARALLMSATRTLTGQDAQHIIPGYSPGRDFENKEIMVRMDGHPVYFSISQSSIKHEDSQLEKIVIIRDVTEDKRTEKLLKQANAQLEGEVRRRAVEIKKAEKMEAIGTLAGGVAHDFNNLLTAILVFAGGARDELLPDHPNAKDIDEVLVAAKKARDIAKQLLVFSRKDSMRRRPLVVKELLEDALSFMETGLPSTVKIERKFDDAASQIRVLGDPANIRQAFVNVLSNAYQAMSEKGGTITASLGLVDNYAAADMLKHTIVPGAHVAITISDEGKGISPSVLPQVFDPLFSEKGDAAHTGLGLTTTKRILTEMSGGVDIHSKLGEGTQVSLIVPCLESLVPGEGTDESNVPVGQGRRILWVDDQDQIPRVGKRCLEPLGYKVIMFTSALEALDAFKADPYHFNMIISDVDMPEMNGLALAKNLLRIRSDIPVILVSGDASHEERLHAQEMGISHFLNKPLDLNLLEAAMANSFEDDITRYAREGDVHV